jgi:hypothetical protein
MSSNYAHFWILAVAVRANWLTLVLRMVDDPATDRFIKWSDDGTSFYG